MKLLKNLIKFIGLLGDKIEEFNDKIVSLQKFEESTTKFVSRLTDSGFNGDVSINQLIIDKIKKDYFTKEFVNEEATNTNVLYVVEQGHITNHLFKEGNQTKDVKKINGKFYLFID